MVRKLLDVYGRVTVRRRWRSDPNLSLSLEELPRPVTEKTEDDTITNTTTTRGGSVETSDEDEEIQFYFREEDWLSTDPVDSGELRRIPSTNEASGEKRNFISSSSDQQEDWNISSDIEYVPAHDEGFAEIATSFAQTAHQGIYETGPIERTLMTPNREIYEQSDTLASVVAPTEEIYNTETLHVPAQEIDRPATCVASLPKECASVARFAFQRSLLFSGIMCVLWIVLPPPLLLLCAVCFSALVLKDVCYVEGGKNSLR